MFFGMGEGVCERWWGVGVRVASVWKTNVNPADAKSLHTHGNATLANGKTRKEAAGLLPVWQGNLFSGLNCVLAFILETVLSDRTVLWSVLFVCVNTSQRLSQR